MWKAYLRFDKYLLDHLQEGYLWLLDRTGVYVATLSFLVYAICAAIEIMWIKSFSSWLWLGVLGFIGIAASQRYILQDKGKNETINAAAMMMEASLYRRCVDILFWQFFLMDIIDLAPIRAVAMLGFILFQYTYVLMVRDRDKKPFFKPAEGKSELAMERGT